MQSNDVGKIENRNFLILEKKYSPNIYVIFNFRKLCLYNERDFFDVVQLNKKQIESGLSKLKCRIHELNDTLQKCRNQNEKTKVIIKNGTVNQHFDEKNPIDFMEWELDLSFNYFENISIDEILMMLIQHRLIGTDKEQGGQDCILRCDNLNTLNLSKNCLENFPCIKTYKLMNLKNIYISHNNLESKEVEEKRNSNVHIKVEEFMDRVSGNDVGILNSNLENLEYVNFQSNKMESFSLIKYLFNHHKKITHMNIGLNKLKMLNNLPVLENLKILNVSLNKLCFSNYSHVAEENKNMLPCVNLNEDCHHNTNSDAILQFFLQTLKKKFPQLEHINMKHNPVYDMIKESVKNKKSNSLSYFPF